MKVLMINGSPREKGCTFTALSEVALALRGEGVDSVILHVGNAPVQSCQACRGCAGKGRCVIDDSVNVALDTMRECDGLVVGSPVHYASASGAVTCFMDRLFYAGDCLAYKPGAAVVSCRRGGASAALDQLNKYFPIGRMPMVPSQYWCMVHGNTPDEVRQDLEGLQIMRTLGRNMAWLLKCIDAGKQAGTVPPSPEQTRHQTNFIR